MFILTLDIAVLNDCSRDRSKCSCLLGGDNGCIGITRGLLSSGTNKNRKLNNRKKSYRLL